MTISYEKLVLLNQGRYQTQDYLSFSFQNLSKYIPLKTSFSYNLVKVKSKNIFGFKYYLNLGTTSQIINVKGLSEVSIKCTNPESHISKFSEFANIVFYLPKVTSL